MPQRFVAAAKIVTMAKVPDQDDSMSRRCPDRSKRIHLCLSCRSNSPIGAHKMPSRPSNPERTRLRSRSRLAAFLVFAALAAGCAGPGTGRSTAGAGLLTKQIDRVQSGVRFVECQYGRAGFLAGKDVMVFRGLPLLPPGSPLWDVRPSGGGVFVSIGLSQCPQRFQDASLMAEDATALPAALSAPVAASGGLPDSDRLWTDVLRLQTETAARKVSVSHAIAEINRKHGPGLLALANMLVQAESQREAIAEDQVSFPTQRVGQITEGTLVSLRRLQVHARRFYVGHEPPLGVQQALAPVADALERIERGQRALASIMQAQQVREVRRLAAEEAARRSIDPCARASKVASSAEPSEWDMCRLFSDDLDRRARAFEQTSGMFLGLMGALGGSVGQGASLRAEIRSYEKRDCRAESLGSQRFICRHRSDVVYENNAAFSLLQSLGISPDTDEALYFKDASGAWSRSMTTEQQAAEARYQLEAERDRRNELDRERRNRQAQCMRSLAGTNYGGLCLMN